jgi:hypothetical protein
MHDERTIPAGHAIAIIVVALVAGMVLNAPGLLETAERQTGATRSFAVGVMAPIAEVSSALRLDAPHEALDRLAHGAPDEPVVVASDEPEPSVTTTTVSATATTLAPRVVTAADPLRLLVAGDSMVGQFGPVLERTAERNGLVSGDYFFEFSTGLTRPDTFDWSAKLRELGATLDPEVLVLYLGANDAANILVGDTWRSYDSPDGAWDGEYRSRVRDLMDQLDESGVATYWMGLPVTSSGTQNDRYTHLNSIYESEAEAFASIEFVPVWDWFTGSDGSYSEYLVDDSGTLTDMRLDDGIHYTTAGAERLAERVFPIIAADFGIDDG